MAEKEDPVAAELRKITKILAIGLLEGKQREKIERLSAAGFSSKDIADTLGVQSKLVAAELSNLKKKAKGSRGTNATAD